MTTALPPPPAQRGAAALLRRVPQSRRAGGAQRNPPLVARCIAMAGYPRLSPGFTRPTHFRSVSKILEIARRRADDEVALRLHFEHREAALHQPLPGEAEQPVDAGEATRVQDRLLGERRRAAALG